MMEPTKRLYRSESNRMVAGVCGGLGEFFGVDATLVRLLFVLLAFFGGGGLVAYLVMWLLVPSQSKLATPPKDVPREGLEELRDGVERGAQGARGAYERWRGKGGEDAPFTDAPASAPEPPPQPPPAPYTAPPPPSESPDPEPPEPEPPRE